MTSELSKKQAEFDHWHAKIRESARARQIEQNQLDEVKQKTSDRKEVDRRIKNLERDSEELVSILTEMHGGSFDDSSTAVVGDADKDSGIDVTEFDDLFPETVDVEAGLSAEQISFLSALPPVATLQSRLKIYEEHNGKILEEVERFKTRNVVLGENYRRVVMACTGWTAEQVDEAAEGLTQCVQELDVNPVPEDEAIEILMKDRGQDW